MCPVSGREISVLLISAAKLVFASQRLVRNRLQEEVGSRCGTSPTRTPEESQTGLLSGREGRFLLLMLWKFHQNKEALKQRVVRNSSRCVAS